MEVGVEDLTLSQQLAFVRLRLFYFNDHVRGFENLLGARDNLCAGCLVLRILSTNAGTCHRLHSNFMTAINRLGNALGGQPDAIFVVLDFLWYTNPHV